MIAEESSRSELKAFVFKSCARMPQVGEAYKMPWDGWASIWRVTAIFPASVGLERYRMHKGDVSVVMWEVQDYDWVQGVRAGFIHPPSDED